MLKSVSSPSAVASPAGKYLTLRLARETYGIAVLKIREIIRMQKITPVPQSLPHVRGVINLRGRVVPVVDLRIWFGLEAGFDDRTCIVVAQVTLPSQQATLVGLIVDSVEEVVTLQNSEIAPTPEFGTRLDTTHLLGMANVKGAVITLLDVDRVIAADTPVTSAE